MKQKNDIPTLRFPEFEGEWEEKKFSRLFKFSIGKNIKQSEAAPNLKIPCVRYGELYHLYNEVITETINRTNVKKPELRFSSGNEILLPSAGEDPLDIGRASALTLKNIAIGRTINILTPIKPNIYSQIFVSYYINQRLRYKIARLAKGVSISNVYNSDLKTLNINLPTLPEQAKIASFLTAIDKKIQALKTEKELWETYKKGMMQKLFSQTLRFKDENGKEFPDWEEKKLGDIGEDYNGLTGKTKKDFGRGKHYIQYKQVFDSTFIKIENCGLVNIEAKEKQNQAKYGDVFFTVSSETPNEVGMSSVLLDRADNLYLNSFCFGFRPNSFEELLPEFSQFLFRSENFRREIIRLAQGSTRYNLSKKYFLKLKLSLPCIQEQQKIASFLSVLDKKIEKIEEQISNTEEWKKGLLQQMFV